MKKIIIRTILAIIFLIMLFAGCVAYQIYDRLQWFCLEDNVVDTYFEVTNAVFKYCDDKKTPPANLQELIPQYIKEIPKMQNVESCVYTVDQKSGEWRVTLQVERKRTEREFIFSSDGELTPEEQKRIYTGCHGWVILRKK